MGQRTDLYRAIARDNLFTILGRETCNKRRKDIPCTMTTSEITHTRETHVTPTRRHVIFTRKQICVSRLSLSPRRGGVRFNSIPPVRGALIYFLLKKIFFSRQESIAPHLSRILSFPIRRRRSSGSTQSSRCARLNTSSSSPLPRTYT